MTTLFDWKIERKKLNVSTTQLQELIAALGYQESTIDRVQFEVLTKAVELFKGGNTYQDAADAAKANSGKFPDNPNDAFTAAAENAAAQKKAYLKQLDLQEANSNARQRAIELAQTEELLVQVYAGSDQVLNHPSVVAARELGKKISEQSREANRESYPLLVAAEYAQQILTPLQLKPASGENTKLLNAAQE